MIVYRIESYKGLGPYTHVKGDILNKTDYCLHTLKYNRPTPHFDNIENVVNDYYFGFSSKDQMKAWFFEFKDILKPYFYITVYKINKKFVVNGKYQVAFNKKEAVLISKIKIDGSVEQWN